MTRKLITDNYFRVGLNVWLFQTGDLLSVHRAWNAARAASTASGLVPGIGGEPPKQVAPDPIAVYRPFPMTGPWWDGVDAECEVIGFQPAGERPDGADKDVTDAWLGRFELTKQLWAVGANHVNALGQPVLV